MSVETFQRPLTEKRRQKMAAPSMAQLIQNIHDHGTGEMTRLEILEAARAANLLNNYLFSRLAFEYNNYVEKEDLLKEQI